MVAYQKDEAVDSQLHSSECPQSELSLNLEFIEPHTYLLSKSYTHYYVSKFFLLCLFFSKPNSEAEKYFGPLRVDVIKPVIYCISHINYKNN
jgi:hypothetical protein